MKSNRTQDMTVGNPAKLILSFSIPILIGNIFQQLYSMVDTIIVGKCIDTNALAAVGATGSMNFLIIGFIIGIANGFAVVMAQRFGAKDMDGLRHSIGLSILLSIGITILVTAISVACTMPLLKLINTPEEIIQDSYRYIVVIFWGSAATILYNLMASLLRAIGDSKTPLYFLIFSSLLNIILDFAFILLFDMGVAGAAWATVISQAISGILCVIYTFRKYTFLHMQRKDFVWDKGFAWYHLQIGLPMAFQFSITAIGGIFLQGALNLFGTETVAGFTAAMKVENLVTLPASTFGVTMANYTGQNFGAKQFERLKEGVRKCTFITLSFSIAASLILFLFGRPFSLLFLKATDTVAMEAAIKYLDISACFFPFLFMIFVYRNVLQGIGKSLMPLLAGFFELIARTVVALTLPNLIGYTGVCLAGPFAWIAASVPLGITYYLVVYPMFKKLKEM